MKIKKLLMLSACALALCACVDEEEKLTFIEVNNVKKELTVGYIRDYGTNNDLTHREYKIQLADKENYPTNFIEFTVLSQSTSRLQEGTYYFEDYDYEKGNIPIVNSGFDYIYDSSNEVIEGKRIRSFSYDYDGSVEISMEDGDYKFLIDLTAEKDGTEYTITGEFHKTLTAGTIYMYK